MTMFEWIKQANYVELQEFVYAVYWCGNYDGKNHACDSPPGGLPSFFGEAILQKTPKECAHAFENSYDWNADFLLPERKCLQAFSEMVEAIIDTNKTIQEVTSTQNFVSRELKERIEKLNKIVNILKEEK